MLDKANNLGRFAIIEKENLKRPNLAANFKYLQSGIHKIGSVLSFVGHLAHAIKKREFKFECNFKQVF